MDNLQLAVALARAEKEQEVISILKDYGIWDDDSRWRVLGDNDNNYSTIGNQQSSADTALVEKIINSIDAILMKECGINHIDMTSNSAPSSMRAAMKQFLNVPQGEIAYLETKERNKLSESIMLLATGQRRGEENLIICDRGEGQTPNKMPDTILSISRSNKLSVPFVQGKFNMGGTGSLVFCGEHSLQLVISKRCPELPSDDDTSFTYWSFTVIRRDPPRNGRRSSMYTYFTDINKTTSSAYKQLLRFKAESLDIIPTKDGLYERMEYGTFFKLFNYQIDKYKTNIMFDLYYRLALLMPHLAHPIRLRECRNFGGHYFETTLSGLEIRLHDDRSKNVENGFPDSHEMHINGQIILASIYVLKNKGSNNQYHYKKNEGVLFTVNGQTQATISKAIFSKSGLSYLAESIIVILDCSQISNEYLEKLFMNSRDRLRDSDFSRSIREEIQILLREHSGLKKLQNIRRSAALQDTLSENKPLKDILSKILKKSNVLSQIFIPGHNISSPFNITEKRGELEEEFKGKSHPSYFKLMSKETKSVPKNQKKCIFRFETDADNDYFNRPMAPGSLAVYENGIKKDEWLRHLGLFNGVATLTLSIPDGIQIGDIFNLVVKIIDDCISDDFSTDLHINIIKEQESAGSGSLNRKKKKKIDDKKSGNHQASVSIDLPNITPVTNEKWKDFDMNEESALVAHLTDDNQDFFINMSNKYLLAELKNKLPNTAEILKAKYKYSMVLIGLSIMSYQQRHQSENTDGNDNVEGNISKITSMISPILLPMLTAMENMNNNTVSIDTIDETA